MREPFPYHPLSAKGWHLAMGLRPLEESKWLEVDGRRGEELALKRELMFEHRDAVVATREAGDEASAELLQLVTDHLHTHHPTIPIDVDADDHPIAAAGRLAQEDFCVLIRDDAWRLQAACVCFPSRWSLATKIGTTLDEIHSPVPLYDERLGRPTNSFFDRLRPERSFWRLNWTMLDSPSLYQPADASRGPQAGPRTWFFRVERQTLRQLPRTKAVVFTIRTYVASLESMLRTYDEFGANLLLALETTPEPVKEYKGWVGLSDALRAALSEVLQPPTSG